MSDKTDPSKRSVLDLVNLTPSQEGSFAMGSVHFEDKGAYQKPQTIRRHGAVRRAEPPLFQTGHSPTLISEGHRYTDGRVVEMPGLPAFQVTKVTASTDE